MYKKLLIVIFISSTLLEASENFIELGIRYRIFESKLNTNIKDKMIISYENGAEKSKKTDIIGKFYLGFESSNIQYYIKTAQMQPAIEFGVRYENQKNTYSFGFIQNIQEEAFVNPYLLNIERDDTKIDRKGIYLGYKSEFEKYVYFNFIYRFKRNSYDNDGLKDSDLARDSYTHKVKAVYNYLFFSSALEYQKSLADGEASSFGRYGFEFEVKAPIKNLLFLTKVGFYQKNFDAINSYFDKTQENNEQLILFYARYNKLLNIKNTYLAFSYKNNKVESNLNLFDKNIKAYNLTIGHKF